MGAVVTQTNAGAAPRVHSARELLGLTGVAPAVLVAFFIVTYAVVGYSTALPGTLWIETIAVLLVSGAAIALIVADGDPMPLGVTVAIGLAGPMATGLVFSTLTAAEHTFLSAWPLSATTALSFYLCVRGRTGFAWASMLAAMLICVAWAGLVGLGFGYGVTFSAINAAVQLMGTFFAMVIRPVGRRVFALQQTGAAAAAAQAAHDAVLDERERQLVRLDARARPLLEKLATPTALTADERRDCALVEAQLRDALRAPTFNDPTVTETVWGARSRGVEVVLLDDHGLDDATDEVRARLINAVAEALEAAESGTVTVRILPPGRPVSATILRVSGELVLRFEYDATGELLSN